MNNLLNNWLFQAIVGNIVCFILAKIAKWFYNDIKTTNYKSVQTPLQKHSKKVLRKQFYISLVITITDVPIFFLIPNQYLKAFSLIAIFFGVFFMYCSFECALECFNDIESNRGK